MKIVCVIPARGGSKGVKNKNIALVNNQPLISYSILDALRTQSINKTYVSTDSEKIGQIALKYGAEVPFLRPIKYSKSDSLDLEWALHFLKWYKAYYGDHPEYIVHLRATTPFRDINVIEEAIQKISKNEQATSLVSVEKAEEVYKALSINGEGFFTSVFDNLDYHLMPRQSFPKTYLANGYVDILKSKTLLENTFHGDRILPFITDNTIEIDNKKDLDYARYVASFIY